MFIGGRIFINEVRVVPSRLLVIGPLEIEEDGVLDAIGSSSPYRAFSEGYGED